jgi:hypothetical protein
MCSGVNNVLNFKLSLGNNEGILGDSICGAMSQDLFLRRVKDLVQLKLCELKIRGYLIVSKMNHIYWNILCSWNNVLQHNFERQIIFHRAAYSNLEDYDLPYIMLF